MPRIAVGMGTCGIGNGASKLFHKLDEYIKKDRKNINLTRTGCFGYCSEEPMVNVLLPGKPLLILKRLTVEDSPAIIEAAEKGDMNILKKYALCKISDWDHHTSRICYGKENPGRRTQ